MYKRQVYTASVYPALAALLGSTYGGNGITTFGVPDERARARLGVDTIQAASGATAARVTFGIAGFTGSLLGAAGGDQRMQSHTHTNTLTDPGHTHFGQFTWSGAGGGTQPTVGSGGFVLDQKTGTSTTGITLTNANVGTGSSQNMMPSIVSFLPLVKT